VHTSLVVEEERILKRERPVETQVLGVAFREVVGLEDLVVLVDEAVAERGPGEKIDRDWVLGAGLRETENNILAVIVSRRNSGKVIPRSQPLRYFIQLFLCRIKIILHMRQSLITFSHSAKLTFNNLKLLYATASLSMFGR
jgi:hypothetical protein